MKVWGDSLLELDDDFEYVDIVILLIGWVIIINFFINGVLFKDIE